MMNYRHWTIAATLALIGTAALFGCAKSTGTNADNGANGSSTMAQDNMSGGGEVSDTRSGNVKDAVATLAKAKQEAEKNGTYNCCLMHPCDQCMLMMGSCPCGKSAADGMPVCQECKGGWDAGDGDVPGKKAEDIKV
ncbi:MAG TPA: hypothetical protein VNI20_05525, partial [Fimbriimonadaceae bacterium]|nr:hypothetical protein [Fimbriimonadaceae bacterium]